MWTALTVWAGHPRLCILNQFNAFLKMLWGQAVFQAPLHSVMQVTESTLHVLPETPYGTGLEPLTVTTGFRSSY
jgi:hypothetical protein